MWHSSPLLFFALASLSQQDPLVTVHCGHNCLSDLDVPKGLEIGYNGASNVSGRVVNKFRIQDNGNCFKVIYVFTGMDDHVEHQWTMEPKKDKTNIGGWKPVEPDLGGVNPCQDMAVRAAIQYTPCQELPASFPPRSSTQGGMVRCQGGGNYVCSRTIANGIINPFVQFITNMELDPRYPPISTDSGGFVLSWGNAVYSGCSEDRVYSRASVNVMLVKDEVDDTREVYIGDREDIAHFRPTRFNHSMDELLQDGQWQIKIKVIVKFERKTRNFLFVRDYPKADSGVREGRGLSSVAEATAKQQISGTNDFVLLGGSIGGALVFLFIVVIIGVVVRKRLNQTNKVSEKTRKHIKNLDIETEEDDYYSSVKPGRTGTHKPLQNIRSAPPGTGSTGYTQSSYPSEKYQTVPRNHKETLHQEIDFGDSFEYEDDQIDDNQEEDDENQDDHLYDNEMKEFQHQNH